MQFSPQDGRSTETSVLEVIARDFHEEFMDMYALAVATAEVHPEQANNEVRNAVNHLARALLAEDEHEQEDQVRKARGHIERAKRDCLKITLIRKHKLLSGAAWRLQVRDGLLPEAIRKRLRTIERGRKSALQAENRGAEDATEQLLDLVNECMELEDTLYEQHHVPGEVVTWVRRLWWQASKAVGSLVLLLGVTYVCTAAVYLMIPDASAAKAAMASWLPRIVFGQGSP